MPIPLFALTPDGQQFEIVIQMHSSVRYVKSLICEEVGLAMHLITLEYNGDEMKDTKAVMSYGIEAGEEIHVVRSEVCTYDEHQHFQRAANLIQTRVRGHLLRRGLVARRSSITIQRAFRAHQLRLRINTGAAASRIQRFYRNYVKGRAD